MFKSIKVTKVNHKATVSVDGRQVATITYHPTQMVWFIDGDTTRTPHKSHQAAAQKVLAQALKQ